MPLKMKTIAVTVTTAGTRVPISSTRLLTSAFNVESDPDNTGNGYVGDSSVAASGANQGSICNSSRDVSVAAPEMRGVTEEIDLSQQYIDADTNGNVYIVSYFVRV
jgi:hypothetical protein